jgi:hypothetical protein
MGIILGPMAEQFFLTSMVANDNDLRSSSPVL